MVNLQLTLARVNVISTTVSQQAVTPAVRNKLIAAMGSMAGTAAMTQLKKLKDAASGEAVSASLNATIT